MYFKGTGIVCDNGLKPTISYSWRERDGEKVRVPFIRFSMSCEDLTKAPVENDAGFKQRPRQIVQVVLPETDYGKKMFEKLEPGRLVSVEGRMNVSSSMAKDGSRIYTNIQVRMQNLQFMDTPINRQIERLSTMMSAASIIVNGDVVTEEVAASIANQLAEHIDKQREGSPVRKVVDNAAERHKESNDPDQPDF